MRKSKKNKRARNKKNYNNYNNNYNNNILNEYSLFNNDNSQPNIENEDNAAPSINPLSFNKNVQNVEGDFAPACDFQARNFNNYINSLNEMKKGKEKIQLNNFNIPYNKNKSKSLQYMTKVTIKQLRLNTRYTDCFILLEIKSNLLPMVSRQFYADDEKGQRVYISIYNFDKKFSEKEFKIGKFIIIKDIYYKEYLDGKIGIRVDNPNNVILFKSKEEAYYYITKEIGDIIEYLNLGDSYLNKNDYNLAMDTYMCCLEFTIEDKSIRNLIFKKLINCCLKIRAYSLALKYCDKYLLIYDESNIDIIKYKIKSLIRLGKLKEAEIFLNEIKNVLQFEEYKDQEIYIKTHVDNTQGIFDLENIKDNDVSEYINPKIIVEFDKNNGNRLIAKESVSKGELLMVSKAFYLLTFEEFIKGLKEYYENLNYKRYRVYYFDQIQNYMTDPEFYLYEDIEEIKKISENDFEKLLDLDDFDNWNINYLDRAKKYPDRQTPNLLKAVYINSINIHSSIFSCEPYGYGNGLWYYPSFINHNCNPNTLEFGINDIYFLYAQRDIKKGEEITRRYFNYGLDIPRKQQHLAEYGFVCKCKICQPQLHRYLSDKNKFESYIKEFENLYNENISDKTVYKSILNIENILNNNNGLEFNTNDYINFYFKAGLILLNRKIYYEISEKFLNKAYILIEGKNFHFECIILHYLYILYNENSKKDKSMIVENKIISKLNEFFGNAFLKKELLTVYKERKYSKLLNEINNKVEYIEDIENTNFKIKNFCCKNPYINYIIIIVFSILIYFLLNKYNA